MLFAIATLKAFMRRNTGKRQRENSPFCSQCVRYFSSFEELLRHGIASHSSPTSIYCAPCNQSLKAEYQSLHLNEHGLPTVRRWTDHTCTSKHESRMQGKSHWKKAKVTKHSLEHTPVDGTSNEMQNADEESSEFNRIQVEVASDQELLNDISYLSEVNPTQVEDETEEELFNDISSSQSISVC